MAAMVSGVASSLVCVLLVVAVVPLVWADDCGSYVDGHGYTHDAQKCSLVYFCCGGCSERYCCLDPRERFSEEEQERCSLWTNSRKPNRLLVLLGSIFGAIIPIAVCVALIICCVAPCCLCYKKCRKRRQAPRTVVTTTHLVNNPGQPHNPSGHQPAHPSQPAYPVQPTYPAQPNYPAQPTYPGYQPVPTFGPPMASAPPPYVDATASAHTPAAFTEGQPLYPVQPPSQPKTPNPDEHAPPPFNPAYGPAS